jgi:hypothetical protein
MFANVCKTNRCALRQFRQKMMLMTERRNGGMA